jgi:hypothetical protein
MGHLTAKRCFADVCCYECSTHHYPEIPNFSFVVCLGGKIDRLPDGSRRGSNLTTTQRATRNGRSHARHTAVDGRSMQPAGGELADAHILKLVTMLVPATDALP